MLCYIQSTVGLVLFYLFAIVQASVAEENACTKRFKLPMDCIPFNSCRLLKRQFEQGKENPQIIQYFQQLICGFESESPKICCPTHETVSQSIPERKTNLISHGYISFNFSEHRNFRLIPKLENCGVVTVIDRIVGGSNAPLGSYPWLARIGYNVSGISDVQYGCAASIISSRYLITAAHCLQGIGPNISPYQIRLSEYDSTQDPDCISYADCVYIKDVLIDKVIIHPEHNQGTKFHDIALIRLKEEILFTSAYIQPVCLPFLNEYNLEHSSFQNPKDVFIAGWGKLLWNSDHGSSILQHIKLPVIPNGDCQNKYAINTKFRIADTQMCVGGDLHRDSCSGDSGGPTLVNYNKGVHPRTFQVGIISFGATRCGSKDSPPGVCTRIIPYLKWILDSMES